MRTIQYSLLITLLMAAVIANADEYKKNQFNISVPPEWAEIPRDIIGAYEKAVAEAAPDFPIQHYDYGFQLESSENWFEYPYVLIQIKNAGRIAEKDLEKMEQLPVQKELDERQRQMGSMVLGLRAGKMVFDRENRIVWMGIDMNVVDKGPVSGLSAMIPTEKGFIQVSGYSLQVDYPEYESIFRSIALSVSPMPELAYKPHWTDNLPSAVSGINWEKVFGKGIIGAIIGGALGLFSYLIRKKKN